MRKYLALITLVLTLSACDPRLMDAVTPDGDPTYQVCHAVEVGFECTDPTHEADDHEDRPLSTFDLTEGWTQQPPQYQP